MKTTPIEPNGVFTRMLVAVTMAAPILLVIAAGLMSEGPERGALVVNGLVALLAIAAIALVLRIAYTVGFKTAARNSGAGSFNYQRSFGGRFT